MLQIRANPRHPTHLQRAPLSKLQVRSQYQAANQPIYRGSLCKSCKSSASTEGPSVKAPTPGLQAASQRIYREPLCRCVGWRGFARICSIYRGPLCKSGKQKIYRGTLCKSRKSRCIYRAPLCKSCQSINQSSNPGRGGAERLPSGPPRAPPEAPKGLKQTLNQSINQ